MMVSESQMTSTANGYVHDENTSNSIKTSEEQTANDDKDQSCQCPDIQYIIIDMAPVTFIDSSGSKILERVSMLYLLVYLRSYIILKNLWQINLL